MEHNIMTPTQIRPIAPNEQQKEGKEYEIKNLQNNKKYKIKFIKGENSIIFNATEIGDIKGTLFKNEVSFNKFEKMDKYFRQFDNIDEIYLDLSSKKDYEIKLEEIENNLKLTLIYEIRNEQKDLPFILTEEKADINNIVMNLCEKSKEIDDLKKENEKLKHQIAELQFYVKWIFKYFDKKEGAHQMPIAKTKAWIIDSQQKDWKKLNVESEKYHEPIQCNIF